MAGEFLYKTIDEALAKEIGIELERDFRACLKSGIEQPLAEKQLPKSENPFERILEDPTSHWDHRSDPVMADFKLIISKPSLLFGKKGVAYSGSNVGVGVEWLAKESKVRGYTFLGHIEERALPYVFEKKNALVKDFTSDVTFRLVFFISQPGKPTEGLFRGNQRGLIVGKIDWFKVFVKGKGSVFPLNVVARPKEGLWFVGADFDDPYVDAFSDEHAWIAFNKENPCYPRLNDEEGNEQFDPDFLKQVLAASFATLLLEIREHYEKKCFDLVRLGERGSIHTAIRYFSDLGISVNGTPAELFRSVLAFIEKEYK